MEMSHPSRRSLLPFSAAPTQEGGFPPSRAGEAINLPCLLLQPEAPAALGDEPPQTPCPTSHSCQCRAELRGRAVVMLSSCQ